MAKPFEGNTAAAGDASKWSSHVMGPPAGPTAYPDSHQSTLEQAHQPYVVYAPVQKPPQNPCQHVVNLFESWSQKAEGIGRNIWHNLTTGPSLSGAAWGKVNLATKALTEGGFESLFRQIFTTDPNQEKLKKTFACYLSTPAGPVPGTLYLSTSRLAFCSDRPLSSMAPSGQEAWSYHKVSIPLGNVENVNPVVMRQNPPEKYIHVVTVDGHEFWFTGFVNFDKARYHLLDGVSCSGAGHNTARPVAIR